MCATRPRGIRPAASNERGAALVTALVVIALLSAVAVGAASGTLFELRTASNHRLATQALGVAEAGLARAMAILEGRPGWRIAFTNSYSHPSLNVQVQDAFDFGADQGTYSVTFASLGPREVLIRSEGQVGAARRIIEAKVLIQPQPAMDFVHYVGGFYEMTRNATYTGNLFFNGDAKNRSRTIITGFLKISGQFLGPTRPPVDYVPPTIEATEGVHPNQPPVGLILAPPSWYQSLADTVLGGPVTWNGVTLTPESVTFISGDLTLSGTVLGRGTVIASGNVTLDNVVYGDAAAMIQVIALGSVILSTKSHYDAVVLAHNLLHIAGGPLTARGAWWSMSSQDDMVIQDLQRDTRLETTPPLPATPGIRIILLEWKEVPQ